MVLAPVRCGLAHLGGGRREIKLPPHLAGGVRNRRIRLNEQPSVLRRLVHRLRDALQVGRQRGVVEGQRGAHLVVLGRGAVLGGHAPHRVAAPPDRQRAVGQRVGRQPQPQVPPGRGAARVGGLDSDRCGEHRLRRRGERGNRLVAAEPAQVHAERLDPRIGAARERDLIAAKRRAREQQHGREPGERANQHPPIAPRSRRRGRAGRAVRRRRRLRGESARLRRATPARRRRRRRRIPLPRGRGGRCAPARRGPGPRRVPPVVGSG